MGVQFLLFIISWKPGQGGETWGRPEAIFLHRIDLWVGCTSQFSCKGRDGCCVSELYSTADLPVTSSWNGIWNIWIGSDPYASCGYS